MDPREASPTERRRRARLLLAAAAVSAIMVAFGLVYLHVLEAQRQLQLDQLSSVATKDQATYERLRLQVAQLESPQHIISTAEGSLGMHQPASVSYLTPPAGVNAAPSAPAPAAGSGGV
ncbi:MAG: hypothetical protein M3R71_00765, partial [Actinomycetota bacterium]|nr:hypothetical protein [Actinomycetota bacterium]